VAALTPLIRAVSRRRSPTKIPPPASAMVRLWPACIAAATWLDRLTASPPQALVSTPPGQLGR